jgi:hypothetical protein
MTGPRRKHRVLNQLHGVNVARAVRENSLRPNSHDALRARVLLEQRIGQMHAGYTVQTQAGRALEVHEQESHVGIDGNVAEASEHAVSVVVGKDKRTLIGHPHEARQAPLI